MKGSFDGINNGRLFGWAEMDGEPVSIDVLIDSCTIATITSSGERPDLHAAGIGNRAFVLNIPHRFLDGQSHEVMLRDSVTRSPILGTPQTLLIQKAEDASIGDHISTNESLTVGTALETAPRYVASARDVVRERVRSRLQKLSLIDSKFYLDEHPDLREANVDSLEHYAAHGVYEKRRAISQFQVARVIGEIMGNFQGHASEYLADLAQSQEKSPLTAAFLKRTSIAIIIHSRANHFMRPIATNLVYALRAAGARAVLRTELDGEVLPGDVPIVVAPHEFFEFDLPDHFRSDDFLLRHISYNTEQLPSPWFSSALRYMMAARALIDLNFQSAVALSSALPTLHALPTMSRRTRDRHLLQTDFSHPLFRWMDPAVLESLADPLHLGDRPIDVFLTGYGTQDRAAMIARAAPILASRYCLLAYSTSSPETTAPYDKMTRALYANNLATATSSKIILNLHRYRVGYFEWERMSQGFLGGATVVATRCLRSPFFEPGRHYFETNLRNVGNLITWLLDTKEGRSAAVRAREAAASTMENDVTPERIGNHIIAFICSLRTGHHD